MSRSKERWLQYPSLEGLSISSAGFRNSATAAVDQYGSGVDIGLSGRPDRFEVPGRRRRNRKTQTFSMKSPGLTGGLVRCLGLSGRSSRTKHGQNRWRIGESATRIFSPLSVPGLCVTIGRYWYLFKPLTAVSAGRFYRFEHIDAYSSGKVVAK